MIVASATVGRPVYGHDAAEYRSRFAAMNVDRGELLAGEAMAWC
jgi:hypothetical protein